MIGFALCSTVVVAVACGQSATVDDVSDAADGASTDVRPDSDAHEGDTGAPPTSLASVLESAGMATRAGRLSFFDLSKCCSSDEGCYANNPTSPYAGVWLPPGPNQTASNPVLLSPSTDGMAAAWRLRADEAVVYVGATPPEAKYFGFTHYLYDREVNGKRVAPFASLGESVNHATIRVASPGAPFEAPTALVFTASKTTEANVRAALVAYGVPENAINLMAFDPALYKTGLEQDKDTFALLLRLAEVADSGKSAAYLAKPGGTVLRVTPKTPAALAPQTTPAARPKNTTTTEAALSVSLDALEAAVRGKRPAGFVATTRDMRDFTPDPVECNQRNSQCLGDSRDTTYPSTLPFGFLEDPEDFLYVIGPNHAATGKATYSSFAVQAVDHLVGVVARTNREYAGSANAMLPADANAPKLYAYKIARTCAPSEPYCVAVSATAGCPTGIAPGAPVLMFARTYVEPGTGTAPDASTLLLDRVVVFHKVR